MTPSEILDIFNDSNPVKNIQYTLNGKEATLSLITSSKADSFHDLEECVRQSLAKTPTILVKMLKDFPKPENKKEIEYYEKEVEKFYFGELQLVSIESIPQDSTDPFTQFVIDDLGRGKKTNNKKE